MSRNLLSLAVIAYKENPTDDNFQPIWKVMLPKINYMAYSKSQNLPISEESIYELLVESMLKSIENYNPKKAEFSTYFYNWGNGRITAEMKKVNTCKHRANICVVPIDIHSNGHCEESNFYKSDYVSQSTQMLAYVANIEDKNDRIKARKQANRYRDAYKVFDIMTNL